MAAQPLLDVNDLTVERHAARHHQGGAASTLLARARRSASSVIRLRQSIASCGNAMLDRASRSPKARWCFRHRRQAATEDQIRPARPRDLDDLPESARGAEPDPQSRRSDRGRAAPARAGRRERPRREGDRGAGAGQDRPPARALPRLSVRIVGRHVPARGDRAGAGLQSAASDRGRADHRSRRHHAESRDGPDRR